MTDSARSRFFYADCTASTSFLEVLIKMANEWRAEKDPTHEQQLDQFPGAHLWNRTLLLHRRAATLCYHRVFPPQDWNKSGCLDNAGLNSYKENCLPHPLDGPLYSPFPSHSRFGLRRIENGCRDFTFSVKVARKWSRTKEQNRRRPRVYVKLEIRSERSNSFRKR